MRGDGENGAENWSVKRRVDKTENGRGTWSNVSGNTFNIYLDTTKERYVKVDVTTVKSKVAEFHTFSCATAEFHAFYV